MAKLDYVAVGGVGAVLQGVHSTHDANIERLLTALELLDARYRMQPERSLSPEASHLRSSGHQLLMTRYGPWRKLSACRVHTHVNAFK